jgi:hypothetical protein
MNYNSTNYIFENLLHGLYEVKKCTLEKGFIVEIISEKERPLRYDPFEFYNKSGEKNLYLKFAGLDETKPGDIYNFISSYGFLGLNFPTEQEIVQKNFEHMQSLIKNNFKFYDDEIIPYQESIADITLEILLMRHVIEFCTALNSKDYFTLRSEYESIVKITSITNDPNITSRIDTQTATSQSWLKVVYRNFSPDEIPNDLTLGNIIINSGSFISGVIMQKYYEAFPSLHFINNNFQTSWHCRTLMSVMYIMLYMDLTRGIVLKRCQNKTCSGFFQVNGNDQRKIYCNENCARMQAQREYRIRKNAGKTD